MIRICVEQDARCDIRRGSRRALRDGAGRRSSRRRSALRAAAPGTSGPSRAGARRDSGRRVGWSSATRHRVPGATHAPFETRARRRRSRAASSRQICERLPLAAQERGCRIGSTRSTSAFRSMRAHSLDELRANPSDSRRADRCRRYLSADRATVSTTAWPSAIGASMRLTRPQTSVDRPGVAVERPAGTRRTRARTFLTWRRASWIASSLARSPTTAQFRRCASSSCLSAMRLTSSGDRSVPASDGTPWSDPHALACRREPADPEEPARRQA